MPTTIESTQSRILRKCDFSCQTSEELLEDLLEPYFNKFAEKLQEGELSNYPFLTPTRYYQKTEICQGVRLRSSDFIGAPKISIWTSIHQGLELSEGGIKHRGRYVSGYDRHS